MGLFSSLFRSKSKTAKQTEVAAQTAEDMAHPEAIQGSAKADVQPATVVEDDATDIVNRVSADLGDGPAPAANIWDLDGEDGVADTPEMPAQPAPDAPKRVRRNKTRLIGFDTTQGEVVSLFDTELPKEPEIEIVGRFPVGWIVVTSGKGRGASFPLFSGLSQIGRDEDQTVPLDFGDPSISRSNHAAIAYDPETHQFLLGHGGKSNIVRLNNKPVISTEELKTGDHIRVGETNLRFVALCTQDFNWAGKSSGDGEDVATA